MTSADEPINEPTIALLRQLRGLRDAMRSKLDDRLTQQDVNYIELFSWISDLSALLGQIEALHPDPEIPFGTRVRRALDAGPAEAAGAARASGASSRWRSSSAATGWCAARTASWIEARPRRCPYDI